MWIVEIGDDDDVLNSTIVLENASFVHVFGYIGMFELTVTSWWVIIAT